MLADVRDDVEIARGCAQTSPFAFAGNLYTRAGFDTGRNANLHRFCLRHGSFPVTERTRRTPPSSAAAIGTLLREPQPAARALYLAAAFARRTDNRRATDISRAVAT